MLEGDIENEMRRKYEGYCFNFAAYICTGRDMRQLGGDEDVWAVGI